MQADLLAGLNFSFVCFCQHTGKHGKKTAILNRDGSAVADLFESFLLSAFDGIHSNPIRPPCLCGPVGEMSLRTSAPDAYRESTPEAFGMQAQNLVGWSWRWKRAEFLCTTLLARFWANLCLETVRRGPRLSRCPVPSNFDSSCAMTRRVSASVWCRKHPWTCSTVVGHVMRTRYAAVNIKS